MDIIQALPKGNVLTPIDHRYTQGGFNLCPVQLCFNALISSDPIELPAIFSLSIRLPFNIFSQSACRPPQHVVTCFASMAAPKKRLETRTSCHSLPTSHSWKQTGFSPFQYKILFWRKKVRWWTLGSVQHSGYMQIWRLNWRDFFSNHCQKSELVNLRKPHDSFVKIYLCRFSVSP